MVTIWTFQHPQLLAYLKAGKTYRPTQAAVAKHGEFAESWEHFSKAYAWMENQFRARVGPLPRSRALIWAWYTPKPDLRKAMWRSIQRPASLLTLRVDPRRLLVSDWEDWHQVLNDAPLGPRSLEKATGDEWDAWADKAYAWPQAKREQSWQRIFSDHDDYLQCVLSEIRPSDVVQSRLLT